MYYNNSLCRFVGFVTYTEHMKVSPTKKKLAIGEKKKRFPPYMYKKKILHLLKSISGVILFVYRLMIGSPKNDRENYPRKCF